MIDDRVVSNTALALEGLILRSGGSQRSVEGSQRLCGVEELGWLAWALL